MLTLEINDARLEQKIIEKAQSIGKSVQELMKDFVVEKIQEEEKGLFSLLMSSSSMP